MGTTPNFSWPYPESSDFVADGATAIENLADAIDTTVDGLDTDVTNLQNDVTNLQNDTGLLLVDDSTFASAAVASFSNVFDIANYSHYRILIRGDGSVNGANMRWRFRTNTTDSAGASDYLWAYDGYGTGGATQDANAAQDAGWLGYARVYWITIDLYLETATQQVYPRLNFHSFSFSGSWVSQTGIVAGTQSGTSFNGFSLLPTSGTITGRTRIYAYNQ